MPPLVPSQLLPPIPTLILPAPPRLSCRRRRHPPAPLAASSSSSASPHSRQPYRRRRLEAQRQTPTPAPRPPSQPKPPPRHANATASRARGQEELEAAIYDFMCRSAKPGAFPTREELVAAGRSDLADAVASSGGWLSLGWSSTAAEGPATMAAPRSSGGGHPDYPPETGVYYRGDLAPGSVDDSEWEEEEEDDDEEEASSSGREPETEETRFKSGIEGMLTRLQKDREQARPPPRSSTHDTREQSDDDALAGNSGAPSHIAAGGRHIRRVPENGSVRGSHYQNGIIEGNNTLESSSNDAWKTWTLGKGGLSHFEVAEVLPTERRKLSQHGDIASVQNDVQRSSNGVAVSDYPSDGVGTERDEIHSRLQSLELDLSSALKTLRSRFDKVLSHMSNSNGATVLDDISDDWELEETKVMQAQEELRSIRAKIAVLEGKIALEIIERNKIIEDKQRRLDEVEKALNELRTVCIMWANPATDVLLVGSFDGWTSQRKLERSENGMFSLNLRLYPGRYEIKFIVDGVWKNDPLRPTVHNNGHENNLLLVT
ncbi:protein FLOURY ENDOSPERM 6, chloroplastic [Zea mays]|uniref:5'-AMP-activated protein kinase-related n=1 Tax=Zea mays TaxID=4577 RepID=A0A1D6GKB1_MAIZE|nr:protein FLOURY ENDOSPERM 6, chloroplastic [Zea mays]AQK63783.1 5'-AMP-activated protein kinase-related [Zea mays]|eukprot:XP_020393488.1 protein FLOURY ENDOSPERM 6, chloroplastic [Zea mays]